MYLATENPEHCFLASSLVAEKSEVDLILASFLEGFPMESFRIFLIFLVQKFHQNVSNPIAFSLSPLFTSETLLDGNAS